MDNCLTHDRGDRQLIVLRNQPQNLTRQNFIAQYFVKIFILYGSSLNNKTPAARATGV